MVDATAQSVGVEHKTDGAVATEEAFAVAHAGGVSFPELVRAHYAWERGGCVEGPAEDHYRELLKRFQDEEGELVHSYWSTRRPSAIALTIKENEWLAQLLTDHDCRIRLHDLADERRAGHRLHALARRRDAFGERFLARWRRSIHPAASLPTRPIPVNHGPTGRSRS